ncbi:hypothetical protein GLYMA_09G079500v4 [Glycine max]|nr:hypothetical protein GLYMA_09G079500v4 [Glycine max]KAG4387977.1 hypothetical protein GLYMA_09G079500v4 [Glycine max]KAG4387978.1 hypothetical protein GLYMA_09G079500v4 [Glycine max]KAH1042051.1 hypothetical protein GYH30_024389 [Glycine max]KAH1042052.1 hypothetical protein GYH30_024389 [Glycine max]
MPIQQLNLCILVPLEILNLKAWEGRAYDYCMENLKNMGFPVDGLAFHPELVICHLWQAKAFCDSLDYYYL